MASRRVVRLSATNATPRPAASDYEAYLLTDHWAGVRAAALDRAEHRCQLCYSPRSLQVHHRTYDRLGHERPMDVTVLCESCHARHHQRIAKGDKRSHIVLGVNEVCGRCGGVYQAAGPRKPPRCAPCLRAEFLAAHPEAK
jgi:hypothetical protein